MSASKIIINKPVIRDFRYVCIIGYGWSGSSACIDLLREFEGFKALEGEFRIAKDPYGLNDLENSLVHNWDFIRHDVAIRDFLNYCKMLSRKSNLFSKVGKNFSEKLNVDFMSESKLYIDKLTDMMYFGDTSVHRYNISAYKNFIMKIRSKIGRNNAKNMYFSRPSEDMFLEETRKYINKLFNQYAESNDANTIILDQAVSVTNILNNIRYFDDMKIIIIDRDPRDIYSNLVKSNVLIGADLYNQDSIYKYVKWHETIRKNIKTKVKGKEFSKVILKLNYEDLVYDYKQSVARIIDFLGGDIVHKNKYSYFNPESVRAKNNAGLWKTYRSQSAMSQIGKELKEYCYND